jgi:hypothetical protein
MTTHNEPQATVPEAGLGEARQAGAQDETLSYLGERVSAQQLLERYNPILLLLPNDPALNPRRPGSWWRGGGRGDYHPCSAEFFISKLAWYPKRRGLLKGSSKGQPEEPGFIRNKVVEANGQTAGWEIDLAPFSSGNAKRAWQNYLTWVGQEPAAQACVTYGRLHREKSGSAVALQYWYLYLYNDAGNTHEGDWETVAIELDLDKGPVQVAYAGHDGGARRTWEGITRRQDRPVVHVARGSHAAYLDHMPLGHKTAHLAFDKGLKFPFKEIVIVLEKVAMKLFYFWGVRDYTASIDDEGDGNQGTLVYPKVLLMPESAAVDDDDWWWMNLHCAWGSSHTRIRDFIAPEPPWLKVSKWPNALEWLRSQSPR